LHHGYFRIYLSGYELHFVTFPTLNFLFQFSFFLLLARFIRFFVRPEYFFSANFNSPNDFKESINLINSYSFSKTNLLL